MTAAPTTFPYDDEEFMEFVGFPEYLASTYGRVFSVRSNKFLTPQRTGGRSAPRVSVSINGRVTSLPLAPTVLTAFGRRPPRPRAMPRYIDGDPSNCALNNLAWA